MTQSMHKIVDDAVALAELTGCGPEEGDFMTATLLNRNSLPPNVWRDIQSDLASVELGMTTEEEYAEAYPAEEDDFLHAGSTYACAGCGREVDGDVLCPDCEAAVQDYETMEKEEEKRFFISVHCKATGWVEYDGYVEESLLEETKNTFLKEHREECGCGKEPAVVIVIEELD